MFRVDHKNTWGSGAGTTYIFCCDLVNSIPLCFDQKGLKITGNCFSINHEMTHNICYSGLFNHIPDKSVDSANPFETKLLHQHSVLYHL